MFVIRWFVVAAENSQQKKLNNQAVIIYIVSPCNTDNPKVFNTLGINQLCVVQSRCLEQVTSTRRDRFIARDRVNVKTLWKNQSLCTLKTLPLLLPNPLMLAPGFLSRLPEVKNQFWEGRPYLETSEEPKRIDTKSATKKSRKETDGYVH